MVKVCALGALIKGKKNTLNSLTYSFKVPLNVVISNVNSLTRESWHRLLLTFQKLQVHHNTPGVLARWYMGPKPTNLGINCFLRGKNMSSNYGYQLPYTNRLSYCCPCGPTNGQNEGNAAMYSCKSWLHDGCLVCLAWLTTRNNCQTVFDQTSYNYIVFWCIIIIL